MLGTFDPDRLATFAAERCPAVVPFVRTVATNLDGLRLWHSVEVAATADAGELATIDATAGAALELAQAFADAVIALARRDAGATVASVAAAADAFRLACEAVHGEGGSDVS